MKRIAAQFDFLWNVLTLVFLLAGPATCVSAQTTISTGSIQGRITDPSGAVVPGAAITITGKSTGQVIKTVVSGFGNYSSGALIPGEYQVRIEAPGFRTYGLSLSVQVGVTANGSTQLELGAKTEVIEVTASPVAVSSDQSIVQGVVTATQIDRLPINGRNFLDLAQLEPGVQMQDGRVFDPTKVGYSSISFGGRFGRTARISVDGVDVSDETVGTTTQNIPSSGIQEFQLSQSNLDLSTDLTSSGAVNAITRTGSNQFHGELFYLIRDSRWGAQIPHPPGFSAPYQRNQFGGNLGGFLVKNRLYFFADYERTKQDSLVPVQYSAPFQNFSGGYQSPFRENMPMARLDWQATANLRVFYRFNYFQNAAKSTFAASSLQVYRNQDYTRSHVAGADFSTGRFAHTFRFQNLKFQNDLGDAVSGSGLPLGDLGVALAIQNGPRTGPPVQAPQTTAQLNRQLKYDGGRPAGAHVLRYGVNYNYIVVGGLYNFYVNAPGVKANLTSAGAEAAANGPFPGGASNPLNYPMDVVVIGNGQGYSTEKPGLGFPAGRYGPDHRFALYLGDTWKLRRNLTLNYGLRYVRDTARTDSDLPAFPQLDALIPGTGGRVRQPNLNFAPQMGVAWDPTGSGRTVIRAGAGLFYENAIFNNTGYDRALRLPSGAFNRSFKACVNGQAKKLPVPGGSVTIPAQLCKAPVGQAAAGVAAFAHQYQSLIPFDLSAPNPNYIVTQLDAGLDLPLGLLAPNYQSPRSLQMNAGIHRELAKGTVLSVDYVRNVNTHSLLGIELNHSGDARYFSKNAAVAAIQATLKGFGASSIDDAIRKGAAMSDFAGYGLGSATLDYGGVCPDYGCAFGGINPKSPAIPMLQPIGRSVYNGLDVKLRQNVTTAWRLLKRADLQAAYSLSRYTNPGGANPISPGASDQDLAIQAVDYNHPLAFTGPALLDRTHQFSFGGSFELPGSLRAATVMHFAGGLPVTPVVPLTGLGSGEIFRTDFTGDGTVGDILPGAKVGSFNRDYGANGMIGAINTYNKTIANQLTPAGQVLVDAGLFTAAQLRALGGVAPTIPAPPANQVGVGALRTLDFSLSWVHKFRERIQIEPRVSFFNLLNMTNYDVPPNVISGLLTGVAGSINGTTPENRVTNRVGVGTGVFALGAPRAIDFGMRVSF